MNLINDIVCIESILNINENGFRVTAEEILDNTIEDIKDPDINENEF
jgi:hypothetical protein